MAGIFRNLMKQTDVLTQNFFHHKTMTFEKDPEVIKFKVESQIGCGNSENSEP
jgi:hypothetical protein